MNRLIHRGRDLLGIVEMPGAGRWAAASLIDAVGSGLLMPLTVLYFTIHVGLSPSSVGLGLTIGGLLALAFGPVAGVLIDALGAKPVLLAYWGLAALAYAGYGLVHNWVEFLIAVTLAEIASSATSTARKALVTGMVSGQDRVRMLASQRSLRNLGFGVGGLLATAALAIGGVAYLFVVYGDAITFLVAIALIAGMPVPPARPVARGEAGPAGGLRRVLSDRRYMGLTVLDFFTSFHATALEVALPLWVVLHTRAPHALAGILFTMNTAIVVLVQVRATAGVAGLRDLPRAYRRAAMLMILCAAAYLAAHYVGTAAAIALLVCGAAAHTGVEMLASAGEWVASIELADPEYRGTYLSVFSLGNSLQDALGPTIITSLLLLGSAWLWPVLAVLVATGTLVTAAIAHRGGVASSRLDAHPAATSI
jgi:MFS family permease